MDEKLTAGPRGDNYVCTHCYVACRQRRISQSFLGYGKFTCPACGKNSLYPLTHGYRGLYWVLVVGGAILCIVMLKSGRVLVPGIAWFAAVMGLLGERQIRKQVQKAWHENDCKGNPWMDVPPPIDKETMKASDPIRWYHVLVAVLLPVFAWLWGVVNLIRRKRRSGRLMIIIPVAYVVLLIVAGLVVGLVERGGK